MEQYPYILSLDTCTNLCSVAISRGAEVLIEEVDRSGDRRHAALLPLMVESVRIQANIELRAIDAICCSMGPGSYTGLRVGLSTAKGLCLSLNKPLIGVSTVEALTYGFSTAPMPVNSLIISMIDAGRLEVYSGIYDYNHHLISPISPMPLKVNTFQSYLEMGYEIYLVGDGIIKARAILLPHERLHYGQEEMRAAYLCIPAFRKMIEENFENIAYAVPWYIKVPDYKKNI